MPPIPLADAIPGALVAASAAGAIALPFANRAPARAAARAARHPASEGFSFCGARGWPPPLCDLSAMAAAAALEAGSDPDAAPLNFAGNFRRWLLSLPPGIGWAALRANLRLWSGWAPDRSGAPVPGAEPAARAVALGLAFGARDREALLAMIAGMTSTTHLDAAAVAAAQWVALLARELAAGAAPVDAAARVDASDLDPGGSPVLGRLAQATGTAPLDVLLREWGGALVNDAAVAVPLAVRAWLAAPGSMVEAVEPLIRLGGACVPAAVIAGGLAGAVAGEAAVPPLVLGRLGGYPWGPARLRALGAALAACAADGAARRFDYPVITPLARNAMFRVAGWWRAIAG